MKFIKIKTNESSDFEDLIINLDKILMIEALSDGTTKIFLNTVDFIIVFEEYASITNKIFIANKVING